MNKLYALFIVTLIIGCDSSRNLSIESLIENKDLDELKKRKKEYVDQMNIMKVELNEINNDPLLLFKFLGEKTNIFEEIRIFISVNIMTFVRSLFKRISNLSI